MAPVCLSSVYGPGSRHEDSYIFSKINISILATLLLLSYSRTIITVLVLVGSANDVIHQLTLHGLDPTVTLIPEGKAHSIVCNGHMVLLLVFFLHQLQ